MATFFTPLQTLDVGGTLYLISNHLNPSIFWAREIVVENKRINKIKFFFMF
jgi:hypothetical protein